MGLMEGYEDEGFIDPIYSKNSFHFTVASH